MLIRKPPFDKVAYTRRLQVELTQANTLVWPVSLDVNVSGNLASLISEKGEKKSQTFLVMYLFYGVSEESIDMFWKYESHPRFYPYLQWSFDRERRLNTLKNSFHYRTTDVCSVKSVRFSSPLKDYNTKHWFLFVKKSTNRVAGYSRARCSFQIIEEPDTPLLCVVLRDRKERLMP